MSTNISRRRVIKAGCIGLGSIATGSSLTLFSQGSFTQRKTGVRKIRLAATDQIWKNRQWLNPAIQHINQHLTAVSDGRLSLSLSLIDAQNSSTSSYDGLFSSPSFFSSPTSLFLGHLPLPISSHNKMKWLQQSEVQEIWKDFHAPKGLIPILLGAGPNHCGVISTKSNLTEVSIKQLRFSTHRDLTYQSIVAIGGKSKQVSRRHLISSLPTKTVDVSEAFSHAFWLRTGFHQNPDLYYYANEWTGSQVFNLLLRQSTWQSLSHNDQESLLGALSSSQEFFTRALKAEADLAFDQIKGTAANPVQDGSELHKALKDGYEKVVRRLCAQDPQVARLQESLKSYINDLNDRV